MRKRSTTQGMAALVSALLLTLIMAVPMSAGGNGATQVSGVGHPPGPGECTTPPPGINPSYAIVMRAGDGDLVGCVYGFNPVFKGPGPSGVAKERADEIFVGSYDDGKYKGMFRMRENWHAKFDLAAETQIFGFCKHPIVKGSGTGDFEGVRGRLDFRDDLSNPDKPRFVYKGHLKNLD